MANLSNPREELKNKSQQYAGYVWYGVPRARCQPFQVPSEEAATELAATWKEKSFWELWAGGRLNQYYLMQWALAQPDCPGLQHCVRFILRVANLASPSGGGAEGTLAVLKDDAGEGAYSAAKASIADIHAATRKIPYDATTFRTSISGLLEACPGSAIDCSAFFGSSEWGSQLCRAQFICHAEKGVANFSKAVKPLLVGVGGYGLVQLTFEDQWGMAFALKRQNITMVHEKKHTEKALLELHITQEINSPFLLDSAYSYYDDPAKDLVIALRMMPGGDVAHHIKEAKKKCEKAETPRSGLGKKAGQYYLASTLLGLEALHKAGYVYRDLKDKNVLLDVAGRARLCDFGLGHDLSTGLAKGKSGTKGFFAPEQLTGTSDKKAEYDSSCDIWSLGVCAFHWNTGKLPFSSDVKNKGSDGKENEAAVNKLTAKAEYKKDNYHLTKSKEAKEKTLFIPNLLELCEGLMTVDHKERLGVKGGYEALKGHAYFNGLNWDALVAGTLAPPIVPSHSEINADVPEKLKDEFKDWAKKDVPEKATENFAKWTGVTTHVVESTAIENLDKNGVFFHPPDTAADKAITKNSLWAETLVAPADPNAAAAGADSARGSGGPAAGEGEVKAGGGCCVIL